jgi:hypothetical protein
MGPGFDEKHLKPQPAPPQEELEGLRVLSRIIAKAVMRDAQAKQSSGNDKLET